MYCYAEYHYAECRYAECHYAECHYAECQYGECGSTNLNTQLQNFFKPFLMRGCLMMLLNITFQLSSLQLRRFHDTWHNNA
jgi:hypothetical protein